MYEEYINQQTPLFKLYKEGEKYFFLIKKPFSRPKIKVSVFRQYKYFNMEELNDSGLLIGYCFTFKDNQPTWSENFLGIIQGNEKIKNYNVIFMNKYLAIIEDDTTNNLFIIGENNG